LEGVFFFLGAVRLVNWFHNVDFYDRMFLHSSFLGSIAQLRPWPLPQNPAEFLGGFSTIFFFTG
jgi:hypothetical protein